MSLRVVHAGLATVCAAGAFALIAAGVWAAYRREAQSVRLVLLVRRVTLLAAGLAVVAGAVSLVFGARPHQPLHYLYAAFALAAVPLATSLVARNPRRGGIYHAGAGALLLLMCFRLASTG
ncbi:MAG: hypothetical protein M3010_07580 [Candidatus Dormibacteraeota bacterium]|nr:hypothetical protein [Candidatus Dormibacteraeota bacterium]